MVELTKHGVKSVRDVLSGPHPAVCVNNYLVVTHKMSRWQRSMVYEQGAVCIRGNQPSTSLQYGISILVSQTTDHFWALGIRGRTVSRE